MESGHDVVVVGAGPVGLTAALALRALGRPAVVLEAEPADRARTGSRAIFLHRESLEHLDALRPGLGWELAANGLVWTTKQTYWGERLVYERTYPPPDPHRLPHATNLSQVVIEAVLLDACKAAGVELEWAQPVTTVDATEDGIVLRAGDREWRAEHVIGADGARSAVRDGIGAELEGPRLDDAFVIVDVATDGPPSVLPARAYYYHHPAVDGRNVLLVPFAGGIRADLQLRHDDDPEQWNDEAGVRRWIAAVLSPAHAEHITWVSTYRFRQVVASSFTDAARRVCLVGEAAHLFAPFGARGLNSGIPDAIVAARAIDTALRDPAARRTAIEHFATTRRDAALYNRDASNLALQHMQAEGAGLRWRRRLAARLAGWGIAAGSWLDASPFGPRAAAHKTETGSY